MHILADLLGTAVQIAQVRHDFGDDLAVGAQDEPQDAVRGRMLRPHVDEHLVGADVELDDGLILRYEGCGCHRLFAKQVGNIRRVRTVNHSKDPDHDAVVVINDAVVLKQNLANIGTVVTLNNRAGFWKITKPVCVFS